MVIERTDNELVIRFPLNARVEQIQDLIDYLRYQELVSSHSTEQSEVDMLAREINKNYRESNQMCQDL
ncbi:MAG: hypothetical protein LBH32_09975 [Dysgonamonadaceae bacterium]|jgi:hypothetical protein|nr:hypothetical protein [Dysgonamonadaceae bacterium]